MLCGVCIWLICSCILDECEYRNYVFNQINHLSNVTNQINNNITYYNNDTFESPQMEQFLDSLTIKKLDKNVSKENCSICIDNFDKTNKIVKLPCGHYFHRDCANRWLKEKARAKQDPSCPNCRFNLKDSFNDINI